MFVFDWERRSVGLKLKMILTLIWFFVVNRDIRFIYDLYYWNSFDMGVLPLHFILQNSSEQRLYTEWYHNPELKSVAAEKEQVNLHKHPGANRIHKGVYFFKLTETIQTLETERVFRFDLLQVVTQKGWKGINTKFS